VTKRSLDTWSRRKSQNEERVGGSTAKDITYFIRVKTTTGVLFASKKPRTRTGEITKYMSELAVARREYMFSIDELIAGAAPNNIFMAYQHPLERHNSLHYVLSLYNLGSNHVYILDPKIHG
jgi:hypothetical protein